MLSELASSLRGTLPKPGKVVLGCLLLLTHSACGEEEDIWKDATVSSSHGVFPNTSPLDNLINSSTFKEIVATNDASTDNQFFRIDHGESLKIIRIYIQNRSDHSWDTFGNLYICIGNDPSSPTAPGNTCSTEPIHEGGFIILDLPAGRYIFFDRRDKTGRWFNLSTAIAFQTPNLLEPQFGATIIADHNGTVGYEKENLNSNLGIRTMRPNVNPTIDADGNTTTDFNSCFRI